MLFGTAQQHTQNAPSGTDDPLACSLWTEYATQDGPQQNHASGDKTEDEPNKESTIRDRECPQSQERIASQGRKNDPAQHDGPEQHGQQRKDHAA